MKEIVKDKLGSTRRRWDYAIKDKAFDVIHRLPILETNPVHFLKILSLGRVATNVHLRSLHSFALAVFHRITGWSSSRNPSGASPWLMAATCSSSALGHMKRRARSDRRLAVFAGKIQPRDGCLSDKRSYRCSAIVSPVENSPVNLTLGADLLLERKRRSNISAACWPTE